MPAPFISSILEYICVWIEILHVVRYPMPSSGGWGQLERLWRNNRIEQLHGLNCAVWSRLPAYRKLRGRWALRFNRSWIHHVSKTEGHIKPRIHSANSEKLYNQCWKLESFLISTTPCRCEGEGRASCNR